MNCLCRSGPWSGRLGRPGPAGHASRPCAGRCRLSRSCSRSTGARGRSGGEAAPTTTPWNVSATRAGQRDPTMAVGVAPRCVGGGAMVAEPKYAGRARSRCLPVVRQLLSESLNLAALTSWTHRTLRAGARTWMRSAKSGCAWCARAAWARGEEGRTKPE